MVNRVLEKGCSVYLKVNGEMCNRLNRGTRIQVVQRKGEWAKITWRSGKKRGWIRLSP